MQHDPSLKNDLLTDVESIAPILAEHAPLSEKLGRLDEATFKAMRRTRLLLCVCPRELGGLAAGPKTVMEVYEAVARIDGSASWGLGIIAGSSAVAACMLPVASARRIFANGVPPMAGTFAPGGTAEPVASGYKVKVAFVLWQRDSSRGVGLRESNCFWPTAAGRDARGCRAAKSGL